MTFIEHIYKGIRIDQRDTDGYINLNQMADATSKRIDKWLDNQSTKDLIAEFEGLNYPEFGVVYPALLTIEGRSGGTWAHPDIAIQFAQWCSPSFALQVSRWIREWLTTGKRPDLEELGTMYESELKLELQEAKNWCKTVEVYLGSYKVRRLARDVEREKKHQIELELDLGDNPDDGDENGKRSE